MQVCLPRPFGKAALILISSFATLIYLAWIGVERSSFEIENLKFSRQEKGSRDCEIVVRSNPVSVKRCCVLLSGRTPTRERSCLVIR